MAGKFIELLAQAGAVACKDHGAGGRADVAGLTKCKEDL